MVESPISNDRPTPNLLQAAQRRLARPSPPNPLCVASVHAASEVVPALPATKVGSSPVRIEWAMAFTGGSLSFNGERWDFRLVTRDDW